MDTMRKILRTGALRPWLLLVIIPGCIPGCSLDSVNRPDERLEALPAASAFTGWAAATGIEGTGGTHPEFNTSALEGCPYVSPDGKTLFIASNRAGGLGGIDIWVSTRASASAAWGQPVNAGASVNSASNDFCPTLAADGHTFFFVSNRAGGCGGDDIYQSFRRDDGSFEEPRHLGCQLNSAGNEAGPFLISEAGSAPALYFSSTRAGGFATDPPGEVTGDADIYRSEVQGGAYGPAALVPNVNSAGNDLQPNLRRDGLEIYFASNRSGTPGSFGTLGGADLFSASRTSAQEPWTTPLNLGATVNSATGDETRPSLAWDALTLYFGSNRPGGEGSSDIFVTTRGMR
jgi:hypothetical protein